MLFRAQNNKIKLLLKKTEKKIDFYIQNQIEQQNLQNQQKKLIQLKEISKQQQSQSEIRENIDENIDENINQISDIQNNNNLINNDIDSYIDPINE
jgi:hypothetical protein